MMMSLFISLHVMFHQHVITTHDVLTQCAQFAHLCVCRARDTSLHKMRILRVFGVPPENVTFWTLFGGPIQDPKNVLQGGTIIW